MARLITGLLLFFVLAALSAPVHAQPQPVWDDRFGASSTGDPGVDGAVYTTASFGNLYVGGNFTSVGGVSALRAARWDGSSWSSLGSGPWRWP